MASARIQAKSGTVEGKENSTTILKEREMAYIYPDEIGKGNVKLICGDGNTEIKDLPYVAGDDAVDMQVSEIEDEPEEEEITSGMKFPKLFGIIKKLITSLQSKEKELDALIATAQEQITTNQNAITQINSDLLDLNSSFNYNANSQYTSGSSINNYSDIKDYCDNEMTSGHFQVIITDGTGIPYTYAIYLCAKYSVSTSVIIAIRGTVVPPEAYINWRGGSENAWHDWTQVI